MSTTLLAPTAPLSPTASAAESRAAVPPASRWAGRVLSGLVCAGLAAGAAMGLTRAPAAVAGAVALGYAPHHVPVLALVELACLVLYLVPRTAVLGAVLLTGYFGGAVASHLRLDQPLLSVTLVPVYAAALLWTGLYLRDARVRALVRDTLRPAR